MNRWSRILVLALLALGAGLDWELMATTTTSGICLDTADSSGGIDWPAGHGRRELRDREDQTQIKSRDGRPADRALYLRWGLHFSRPWLAHPVAHPRALPHALSPMPLPLRGGGGRGGCSLVASHAAITAGEHVDEYQSSVGGGRAWAVIARDGEDGALITHCLLRRCVPGYYFPHNVSGWVGGVWDGRPAPPCELCGATPMHRCVLLSTRALPLSLLPSRLLSFHFAISLAHLSPPLTSLPATHTHKHTHTHTNAHTHIT